MALAYLSSTLTEEEYLAQRFKQSRGTGKLTHAALKNAKLFCTDALGHELKFVMQEMSEEIKKTQQLDVAFTFLQRLATWMAVPHLELKMTPNAMKNYTASCIAKDVDTIKGYIGQLRLYMRKVGGIPISSEDLKDYKISYPPQIEKEEPEPMLLSEFKIICGAQKNFRRQMLYRIIKGSEARIGASVQLRKKHFNIEVRPIEIFFPAAIMKKKDGKSSSNTKYVITEDEEELLQLLKNYDDEDLVFGTNEDPQSAVHNEERAWRTIVNNKNVQLNQKYKHNNKLKKTLHSIKSMTFTAAEEAVDETYANAYGDHTRYTKNYLRWTKEKKIAKFRLLEQHISIYTKIEKIDNPEIIKKMQILEDKIVVKDKLILKISKEKKDQTKRMPDSEKIEKVKAFMEEHNML